WMTLFATSSDSNRATRSESSTEHPLCSANQRRAEAGAASASGRETRRSVSKICIIRVGPCSGPRSFPSGGKAKPLRRKGVWSAAPQGTPACMDDIPPARGPLTQMLLTHLRGEGGLGQQAVEVDPRTDDDLHLALYLCYQMHYGGLHGVSDDLEWDPDVLAFRDVLDAAFEDALL